MDKKKYLDIAVKLAKIVGQLQIENIGKLNKSKFEMKSTNVDLVTEIDKKSEEIIINGIKKHFPDHSILAEESGSERTNSDFRWVIDPLDGTINYSQGMAIFTISIALKYKKDTICGVIYAPYLDEMFTAIKDEGAYLNGEKIEVGDKDELVKSVLATGFPYDKGSHKENNVDYFAHMMPKLRGIRRFGSAAYDLASVACGRFDGYWEMALNEWDIAAGLLLVTEAGGEIGYFRRDRKYSIIAGNKKIVKLIRAELKKAKE